MKPQRARFFAVVSIRIIRPVALMAALAASRAVADVQVSVDAGKPLSVSVGRDDVAHLKRLALNVGSEFGTNRVTDAYLKSLGIQRIRLINVGISGRFDEQGSFVDVKPSPRLARDLGLCRRLNARPHIVIHGLPDQLLESVPLKVTRHRALGIDLEHQRQKVGPTDYGLLESWYLAYFEYIKIQRGFGNAVFEIFNEPDLGTLIYPDDNIPPKGSGAAYDCMLKIYRAASAAGKRFEAKHAPMELKLGGPAITLAFTFKRGPNHSWAHRFVTDCGREGLKLDYLSLHNYASVAAFRGAMRPGLSNYPSFADMLGSANEAIAAGLTGLPVWVTEYGPHHNVAGAIGEINGTHDGAAHSLDCLTAMLELGIDSAVYLVTTDRQHTSRKTGKRHPGFSWCSLMTDPGLFGYPYPKAPFHAYKMVSELSGKRISATTSGGNTRVFAAADPESDTVRVLLWNYATYIPELKPQVVESRLESIQLSIAKTPFLIDNTRAVLRRVDKDHGDVVSAFRAGRTVDLAAATPRIRNLPVNRNNGTSSLTFDMPPGSIAMLELGPNPSVPSLRTVYPEAAERLLKTMRTNKDGLEKRIEAGQELLQLPELHEEQRFDALRGLTAIAGTAKRSELAERYAQELETLCEKMGKPLPCVAAKTLASRHRALKQLAPAITRYRQALAAPDCDWRSRFGIRLAVIDCLSNEKRYAEIVTFCDEILAVSEQEGHPKLAGDFRLRKLRSLRALGQTEAMITTYGELLASEGKGDAKVGGVIDMVNYYRHQGNLDQALAEGKRGLEIPNATRHSLNKLKSVLAQVEAAKGRVE